MATYTKVRPYVPALGVSGEAPPVGSSQKPTLYTVEQLAFQMPAIVELEGSIPSAMHTSASAEHSLDDDLLKPSDFRGDTSADNPACPDGSKGARIAGSFWAPSPRNRPLLLRSARVSPRVPVPPPAENQDFSKGLQLSPRNECVSGKAKTAISKTGNRPSTAGPHRRPISANQRPRSQLARILGPDDKPGKNSEKETAVKEAVEKKDAVILQMYRNFAGTQDNQENGNASIPLPDARQNHRAHVLNLEPDMAAKLPAPGVFGARLQGDSPLSGLPARTPQRPLSARSADIGSLYHRQMQRTDTNFTAAGQGDPPSHFKEDDKDHTFENWKVDCFGRYRPTFRDSGSRLTTGRPALGLDLNPRDSRQHLPDDVDGGLSLDVSAKPIQPTPRSRQENKSPAPKVQFVGEPSSPRSSPREHIDLRHLSPRLLHGGDTWLENALGTSTQLTELSAPMVNSSGTEAMQSTPHLRGSEARQISPHIRPTPGRTVTFLSHEKEQAGGNGPWQVSSPCPNCGFQHQSPVLGEYTAEDWNPDTIQEQSSGEEAERPDSNLKIDWLTFALSRSENGSSGGPTSNAWTSRVRSAGSSPFKPFSPNIKPSKVRRAVSEGISSSMDPIKLEEDIQKRVEAEVKQQLEEETGTAMRRIQELTETVAELKANLQEAEAKMQETELQHLKDIANRTKEIQVDASRAREEVEAREEKIKGLESQLLDGEKQLRALRAQRAAKLADWERAALKEGQEKLRADQQDLQKRAEQHQRDLEAAQSVLAQAQSMREQATKLDEHRTRLDDLETRLNARDEALQRETAALELKKAELAKEIELSVGASAYDKSELLKELRLATVANIAMKAELEQMRGNTEPSKS